MEPSDPMLVVELALSALTSEALRASAAGADEEGLATERPPELPCHCASGELDEGDDERDLWKWDQRTSLR